MRGRERRDAVQDTAASIGDAAEAIRTDVSDPAQVNAMIARCVELNGRIDVLVNNAGVNIPGVLHEVRTTSSTGRSP